MSTPGEAVLERVKRHRETAAEMERFSPDVARVLREAAADYERDVLEHTPEWWSLQAVSVAKGWAHKTLQRMAARLEASGKARKNDNGHWELRWDAVYDMKDAPRRLPDLDVGDDISALAEQLAAEG